MAEQKKVLTPSYWQEEQYQPLVEVETAYGNKVRIPQSLLSTWAMWEEGKQLILPNIEQAKAAGWFEPSKRNPAYRDLKRVFFELYQE